ncbi:hypothetical protein ABOZ73_00360 [Caulobacter sp. 73W]|uniref:Uncharacterized protein n=1 Tax=Caulobacter sp. 73W TaxID=3161137 RepID=A0AB39KUE0_9CAUL
MTAVETLWAWLELGRSQTEAVTPYLDPGHNLRNILNAVREIDARIEPDPVIMAALHIVIEAVGDLRAKIETRSFVSSVEGERAAVLRAFDQLEVVLQKARLSETLAIGSTR